MGIDIGICQKTSPPVLIPVSERALKKLDLPEGADCCIFLENNPLDIMSQFPDDWMVAAMPEYSPVMIAVAELARFSS